MDVFVETYGAIGDGTTDDTTAIQAALDAVENSGGGTALFHAKTYIITSILLGSNVGIRGTGPATILKLANGTNPGAGFTFPGSVTAHVVRNKDATSGNIGIVIRDLIIDGNKANNTTGYYNAVWLKKCSHSLVTNVRARNCKRPTSELNGYGEGIRLEDSTFCRVIGCETFDNDKDGIKLMNSQYCAVIGNVCRSNGSAGIQIAYDQTGTPTKDGYNTISGNTVYWDATESTSGLTDRASMVRIHGSAHNAVVGNIGRNVHVGLDCLEGANYNEWVGNNVSLRISNNPTSGGQNAWGGIFIEDFNSVACIGNTYRGNEFVWIEGTGQSLVKINRGTDCVIEGNTFFLGTQASGTFTIGANSTRTIFKGNHYANFTPSYSDSGSGTVREEIGDLAAHAADTTSVHGIADTSALETTTGAQAKVDAHTGDATAAHAASAIAVTPFGTIAATTVQAALEEIVNEATGGTDDQTAAEVPFTPAGSISATDVQAAIEQLESGLAAGTIFWQEPQGMRLSPSTNTYIPTSDVTGASTLYWTPKISGGVGVVTGYNGSALARKTVVEKSLALSGLTSGKNYDVFYDYDGDALALSAAWTNDTTRADALADEQGAIVLGSDHTKLWLGTIYTTGTTTTESSAAKRFVWNAYNRVRVNVTRTESTATWTYTTDTFHQANASAANQIDVVTGLAGIGINLSLEARASNTNSGVVARAAIGEDSTTTPHTNGVFSGMQTTAANVIQPFPAFLNTQVPLGRHFYTWLERSAATGATTWYGLSSGSAQLGISGQWEC